MKYRTTLSLLMTLFLVTACNDMKDDFAKKRAYSILQSFQLEFSTRPNERIVVINDVRHKYPIIGIPIYNRKHGYNFITQFEINGNIVVIPANRLVIDRGRIEEVRSDNRIPAPVIDFVAASCCVI